jgi:hypothetical protein
VLFGHKSIRLQYVPLPSRERDYDWTKRGKATLAKGDAKFAYLEEFVEVDAAGVEPKRLRMVPAVPTMAQEFFS